MSSYFHRYFRQVDAETPYVVYSEQSLLEGIKLAKLAGGTIYYAVKACPFFEILRIVDENVDGFEVQSEFELDLLDLAGIKRPCIVAHGAAKTTSYIERVHRAGGIVYANSLAEYSKILSCKAFQGRVGVRVNFGLFDSRFSNSRSKLGMSVTQALEVMEEGEPSVDSFSIHNHSLCREVSLEKAEKQIDLVGNFLEKLPARARDLVSSINLGGGVDSPLNFARQGLSFTEFQNRRAELVSERFTQEIKFEYGHLIIEDAACAVTSVVDSFADGSDSDWCIVDIGTNLLVPIPSAKFHVDTMDDRRKCERYNVADIACSPAAVIASDVKLPAMREGEKLVVEGCGAYTYSLSENFSNYIPPAFILRENGEHKDLLSQENSVSIATQLFSGED